MLESFTKSGVSIRYPSNWSLDEDDDADGGWTATLQTPGSAVLWLSVRPDAEPAEVADETLEALQDDYPDLENQPTAEMMAGRVALGHDIDFITLDVPVTAHIRVLDRNPATLLLFWQFSGADGEHYEPLLRAVLASLQLNDA
jgi:hypothetical protein